MNQWLANFESTETVPTFELMGHSGLKWEK